MGNKTISAGTNINMALGIGLVNPAGHNQVLPKVLAFSDTGFGVAVVEAGAKVDFSLMDTMECSITTPVDWKNTNRFYKADEVQSKLCR